MPTGVILEATNLRGSQAGLFARLGAGVALPGAMCVAPSTHPPLIFLTAAKRATSGNHGDFCKHQTIAKSGSHCPRATAGLFMRLVARSSI